VEDELFYEKSRIAHEILNYLVERPDAQDTLDGIVSWWLLEQKIIYHTNLVKEAIAELVKKELLLERKKGELRTLYRINSEKVERIRKLIKKPID
jgi:hypothetical protein